MIGYGAGDGSVLRSSALMDERLAGDWGPVLVSPVDWSRVLFFFEGHLALTQAPAFIDNLLFLDVGLVFNAGEFVEGFSSPLHALLLIALRALQLDWMHAITLLGVACFAGFGWLVIRLNRELSPEGFVFDLPLAVFVGCYGTLSFFTSGLETPFAHLAAPAVALHLLRPRGLLLTAIVAAAPLARPELAIALVVSFSFRWWRDRRQRIVRPRRQGRDRFDLRNPFVSQAAELRSGLRDSQRHQVPRRAQRPDGRRGTRIER